MISYEEALARARKLKGFFDCCTETDNAWLFHSEGDTDALDQDACIVMKDTGECLSHDGYARLDRSRYDRIISTWRL